MRQTLGETGATTTILLRVIQESWAAVIEWNLGVAPSRKHGRRSAGKLAVTDAAGESGALRRFTLRPGGSREENGT